MINIQTDFTWKTAHQAANILVFEHTGKYLSDLETIILHGAWNNHTYEQIAEAQGYTSSYLCRDVGCKLWGNLSTVLKEKVSKKNFKAALQRQWKNCLHTSDRGTQLSLTTENLIFPEIAASSSSFYIERSPIESICYETILKPGSLIRIKGAKWMGKTSLIKRILEQGNMQAQKTVYLDFNSVKRSTLQNIDKLLRWMFLMISRQLRIEKADNWDTDIINSDENTLYFEKYILNKMRADVIIALDNIDRLFCFQNVAIKFLKILNTWHETAKSDRCWSKLKLILSHSIKARIPVDIQQSPFNAGVPVLLEEFNYEQVNILANLCQIDLDKLEISRLMDEVGGHPYLIRLAIYQMKTKNVTLEYL